MNHDIFLPFDRISYRSLDDLAVARRQCGLHDHYWKRYALSGRKSIRSRVYGRIPAARPVVRGIVVGIMVALPGRKHHDYPTRTHAVTPADHSYTEGSVSPAWTTPESASCRYRYRYCYWVLLPSLELATVLPELIAAVPCRSVHFWDTSNREMQRLVLRNCVSLYCLYLATFFFVSGKILFHVRKNWRIC